MDKDTPLLIVGLGNPGRKYENTRHNIGAYVLFYFVKSLGAEFKSMAKVDGYVAQGVVEGRKIIFLLPTTYMNLSGGAVVKCMKYYNISAQDLLVLSDDTYISFAEVRLRVGGSAGGHNGLKDIENCLGTKEYPRLRIGIGEKTTEDLADFVLQDFSKAEMEKMDEIVQTCVLEIKKYVAENRQQDQKEKQKEDLRRD